MWNKDRRLLCKSRFIIYAEYTQKNGAVSNVNKKFVSHLTRAQRTLSAAATVQVSHALPAVCFSCILRGRGASFQDGVTAGNAFCVLRFEVSRSGHLKTEHTESVSCCDTILETGPAAPQYA